MSSIGSALVTQPHDPPITAYNWPDSQDHERTGRRSPGRAPSIVKIIATPLHRNLGIDAFSLPSGGFEEQIRRGFRDNAKDRLDTPFGGLLVSSKTSTVRKPIDGCVANGQRVTSGESTVRAGRLYAEMGPCMKYSRDVQTFDDLDRIQHNVASNHRPKPTKVIEVRRQLDLQRTASSSLKTNEMKKAFAKAKRREKQPPHQNFVVKPAFTGSLLPPDESPCLSLPNMICSNPGGDPTALPTLSELIGSNVLEQAQEIGSPLSVPHVSSRRNSRETGRESQGPYELNSLGAALPPEMPAGTWNFRPIAASLPYLRPEMKAQSRKKPELDLKPFEGTDTPTRKKVRFARESTGRMLEVHKSSRLEKRSYTEKNRAASRASTRNTSSPRH